MSTTFDHDAKTNELPKQSRFAALRRHWKIGLLAACVLGLIVYVLWTKSGAAQSRAARQSTSSSAQPIPVVAVPAKTADIGVYLTALSSVTSFNTVNVKSRVDGQLMKVLFQEG